MKIQQYKTVAETSIKALDDGVNDLIAQGFQPFGAPYSSGNTTDDFMACQAMVKIDSIPAAGSTLTQSLGA